MSADTTVPAQLGNYDIVSKIAEGGMGTVYKARHRSTGEVFAVKVIAAATAKNPILLQRFEREFMAARVLDHPNVVRAIEYCGTGPHPFLVMEYVDGESLGQWIERAGAVPEAEAVRITVQVCEGLQRAHKQGLVHRDVKPDNILVTREGVAKLTDMGLVKDVEGDLNLTKTGRGLGTPHYMAPEQFRNAKNVDVRGDIYSLGATLYALVTGVVPFENASPLDCWMKKIKNEFPPPKQLNPAVSDRVDWAIRRAMSAEPDRRPASCREFVEDLTGQSRMTPTQSGTRPGLPGLPTEVWYFVYKDETGATQTRKGNTEKIREAIQSGHLGDPKAILVSRTKTGQFQSLASVPEFRDLVVAPAALPTPGGQRKPGSSPSGRIATSEVSRTAPDADEVDLGARPGSGVVKRGSRSGASGRQPPPAARTTPTNADATTRPTPRPAVDPDAETEVYGEPLPEDEPEPLSGRPRRPAEREKPPFDWTPVMVVVVVILSAFVGYLMMTK
jgi:serine/threonine protein kinase